MSKFTYTPAIFDVPDEATAKRIILTPEGRSTAERWQTETPGLAALAVATLRIGPQSHVVDYGCGIGRMSKALIERTGCRGTGVDISPRMREMAPDYVQSPRFEAIAREEFLERGPNHDAALAIWVLQHCQTPAADCEVIRRSLRPEGRLLVVNNHHRAVPVAGRAWVNDGFDLAAHLESAFVRSDGGALPAALIGETLAPTTFWGVYGVKPPE